MELAWRTVNTSQICVMSDFTSFAEKQQFYGRRHWKAGIAHCSILTAHYTEIPPKDQ